DCGRATTLSSIITARARRLAVAASATPIPSSGEKKPANVGEGAIVAVGAVVGDALGFEVAVDGATVGDADGVGVGGVPLTRTSPPSATATTARTAIVMTCQPRNPRNQAAQRLVFTKAWAR